MSAIYMTNRGMTQNAETDLLKVSHEISQLPSIYEVLVFFSGGGRI